MGENCNCSGGNALPSLTRYEITSLVSPHVTGTEFTSECHVERDPWSRIDVFVRACVSLWGYNCAGAHTDGCLCVCRCLYVCRCVCLCGGVQGLAVVKLYLGR